MPYYRICPKCGSALDPGEQCDCEHEQSKDVIMKSNDAQPFREIDQKIEPKKESPCPKTQAIQQLQLYCSKYLKKMQ